MNAPPSFETVNKIAKEKALSTTDVKEPHWASFGLSSPTI
jgi:hypothetical protein